MPAHPAASAEPWTCEWQTISPQHTAAAGGAAAHHDLPSVQSSAARFAEVHHPAAATGHATGLPAAATAVLHTAARTCCCSMHSVQRKKTHTREYALTKIMFVGA